MWLHNAPEVSWSHKVLRRDFLLVWSDIEYIVFIAGESKRQNTSDGFCPLFKCRCKIISFFWNLKRKNITLWGTQPKALSLLWWPQKSKAHIFMLVMVQVICGCALRLPFYKYFCKDMLLMSKCPLAGSLEPAKLVVLQICFHLIISCFTFRHVTATSKHYPSGVVHWIACSLFFLTWCVLLILIPRWILMPWILIRLLFLPGCATTSNLCVISQRVQKATRCS